MAKENSIQEPRPKLLCERTEPLLKLVTMIAAVVLVATMCLVCADVIGRYVFLKPISGTTELGQMAMILFGYFGMAYGLRNGRAVRMTALYVKFPAGVRRWLDVFLVLLMIAFMCFFVYSTYVMLIDAYVMKERMESVLVLYTWWAKACLLFGSGLMLIQCFITLYDALKIAIKKIDGVSVLKG